MLDMLACCLRFDENIVNIIFKDVSHEVMEDGCYGSLIGCPGVFETFGHNCLAKRPPLSNEGGRRSDLLQRA